MKTALIDGTRICEFKPLGKNFPVAQPLHWVDVGDDTSHQDTYVDGAVVKYVEPETTATDIALYAEELLGIGLILSPGTVSPGTRFKCNDQSVNRIHALCTLAERQESNSPVQVVDISFRTSGGVTIYITSAAEAWAIYDEVTMYAAAVLDASATAQSNPPADPSTVDWPNDGSA